ncbi:hypothetical protein [Gordonia phthalatica]|uniref:Uncharacterized protein n=1 Tax=Gordonia phthalatica TaxID=1136941 RepID=A0A0N7FU69_9ACTN|nr:hypothetical protein [Gordonia phthalatica]ALG83527.1 hypothetical protein ACH46_02140 [Gordonia phthalatica]
MSGFIDKIKGAADAVRAAIDNELTVLEGAGGDDPLSEHDDAEPTAPADSSPRSPNPSDAD